MKDLVWELNPTTSNCNIHKELSYPGDIAKTVGHVF
jgi:hypothetical protein